LLLLLLNMAILTGVRWNLTLLICIFFITREVELFHVSTGHLYFLLWELPV
jgi:hypothetical protein